MRKVIIFALLILMTVGYIWGNSLKSKTQSAAQSSQVAEAVQPVVDPQQKIEKSVFHDYVRKAAHLTEFFVLGVFTACFAVSLGAYLKKRFVSMPLLLVLSVAVGDEFIQRFTGRGSLVSDVVLDFLGALLGLGAGLFLYWAVSTLIRRVMARKEQVNG